MKKNTVLHLFMFCSIIYLSCTKPDLGKDFGNWGCFCGGPPDTTKIYIYANSFSQDTAYAQKGLNVSWMNTSFEIHALTSDGNVSFNSGNIYPDSTYIYTTRDTGVFKYHCTLHNEKGVLIVRP